MMELMKRERSLQLIYLLIGCLAFCYVLIRALQLSITYDEAYTLAEFVHLPVMEIINYSKVVANNHILNTLLIKLAYKVAPDSLFIARLPNVLSFIVYLFFAYKLTFRNLSPIIGIGCFLLLVLNPFLLDFFGLARGYGLSLACMMAALYYAVENARQFNSLHVIQSIGWASLSVISNFSMLNFWVVLVFVLNVLPLLRMNKVALKKTIISSLIHLLVLVVILYEPIRKLKMNGALFYGGDNNFYADTLISLTKYSLYSPDLTPGVFWVLNTFLLILLSVVVASFVSDRERYSAKNIFLLITSLCVLSVIVQHYLLGTLYLLDRTALFFYPLLIFCLCFSLNVINKYIQWGVMSAMLGVFLLNFLFHFNTRKTVLWSFDAHSKEILARINEIGKAENRVLQIDFSWPLKSSVNYYLGTGNYPFVENGKDEVHYNVINHQADYYIFLSKALENTGYNASKQNKPIVQKKVLVQFPQEHLVVYEHPARKK